MSTVNTCASHRKRKHNDGDASPGTNRLEPDNKNFEDRFLRSVIEFITVDDLAIIVLSCFKCPVCGIHDLDLVSCDRFWNNENPVSPVLCRSCVDFFPHAGSCVVAFACPPPFHHMHFWLYFDDTHADFQIRDLTEIYEPSMYYECELYAEWGLRRLQWRCDGSMIAYAKTLLLRFYFWMQTVCNPKYLQALEEMHIAFQQYPSESICVCTSRFK
jgi:hypothetical protein